jgi:hypothetical protein
MLHLAGHAGHHAGQPAATDQAVTGTVPPAGLLNPPALGNYPNRNHCLGHVTCYILQGMLGITLANLLPQIRPVRDAAPPAGLATTHAMPCYKLLAMLCNMSLSAGHAGHHPRQPAATNQADT